MPRAKIGPVTACDATIAICTYNRISTLPRVLDCLRLLRGPFSFEVLVVNGPSNDGTKEYLQTRDDIRVFDNPELNVSISCNIAIANAAGKYIAFIDDDAVPEADWLTLLLDRFNEAPGLAALSGTARNANKIDLHARHLYCDVFGSDHPCENKPDGTPLRVSNRESAAPPPALSGMKAHPLPLGGKGRGEWKTGPWMDSFTTLALSQSCEREQSAEWPTDVACNRSPEPPTFTGGVFSTAGNYCPRPTCINIVFHRERLMRIGGFDEAFAFLLNESDVSKRMADAGMRTEVLPVAQVLFKCGASHEHTTDHLLRNVYLGARSFAFFALRHRTPETGWEATTKYLQSFYKKEFKEKQEAYAYGQIDKQRFETLMVQLREGILAGIDRFFDVSPTDAAPKQRVMRHFQPRPAVIRKMRGPESGLRLCMFSQDHAREDLGGIGRWTNLAARGLAELGHEVTVIGELSDDQPHEHCDFTAHGFWSHNLRPFGHDSGDELDCLGLPSDMVDASKRKLAELRRMMPRRQFQVASTPIWDVEGAALIGAGDIPTVLSLHTCAGLMLDSHPEWPEDTDYFQQHVLPVIKAERQAVQRSQMILANSKAIMRDISALYGLSLFDLPHAVVPHGVDDIPAPKNLLQDRIDSHREVQTPLRVLFLGRLETRKGVAHLVPVLDELLTADQNVIVDLVGKWVDDLNFRLVSRLLEKHPGRVTWHGFLSDAHLDALMRRSDIFFAPSLYESFGLIYIEAMRYAIPCVAYATGGIAEVVENNVDGFLAPLGDQKALYQYLARLVDDSDLRNRMSQSARRNFLKRFHYRLMADRLADVYRETLRSGVAGRSQCSRSV